MTQSAGAVLQEKSHCPPGCTDAHRTSPVIAAASDLAL
jgi:hypothetical protein